MPLRSRLIRLAHSNPELRPHLLPLLTASHDVEGWGPDLALPEVQKIFEEAHRTVTRSLNEANNAMVAAANASRRNPIAEKKALPTVEKILRGIRDASEEVNLFGHYAGHLTSYDRLASEE